MNTKISILIFCLCSSLLGFNQENVSMQFLPLESKNQLSQQYITCIFQDSIGYIWIGTFDGLNRFDGHKFETFYNTSTDSLSLPDNTINTIYQDKNGILWIGTQNGLCKYNAKSNNFVNFNNFSGHSLQLTNNEIRAIYIDDEDILWLGTYGGGIDRVDFRNNTITNITTNSGISDSIKIERINCFTIDSDKNIWVGTEGGGLYLLNKETLSLNSIYARNTQSNVLLESVVNCIVEDKFNTSILWIGTWNNGLVKLNKDDFTIVQYANELNKPNTLNNNTVRAIEQDASGNLWISTFGGGVSIFNTNTETFTPFINDPYNPLSLSYNLVWSSLIDKSGVLWLGTFGGGINKCILKNRHIIHLKADQNNKGLNHNSISSIHVNHKGLIWIGTVGSGLCVYNIKTNSFKYFLNNVKPGVVVRDIYEDRLNRIWIATENGLYVYNEDKNTISLFTHALLDKPIYCIYEDRFNDLWFGTFDAGIFKLSRKESLRPDVYNATFTHYLHSASDTTSLLSNRIWSIYEDSESILWIGTFLSLEKFNRGNENFTHYKTNIGSNSETNQYEVNTIFESKNGQLWLGTSGGGLATFDKKTETINYCKTPKEVYGIIEDEKGYLWLSTAANGICKYNTTTKTFQIFNSFDGLQGEAFERKAFGKSDKGNLIFGGIKGVNIFHPDSILQNNYIPPIVITDFKLFNKSVARLSKSDDRFKSHFSELKSIELSYKENVFAIEFSALDFLSPSNDKYAYMLEGFDKDWIYTDSENNSATYTNLDGGKYTFKVKASNSNNLWNEEATELKITVHPPYWKKWWFRLLVTLVVAGIAIAIIKNRLKSYKIQKLELERLVRSKTSELTHQKEKLEQSNIELQKQKEEIISQRDNLKELANQVEEANFRKMRFFTNISHELRTPLTLLISPINRLLKSEKLDAKINDDLQLMKRNGLRLQKLVNQLMDFRKIETGTMPLLVSQNNIVAFVKNIKETFDGIANQYSINYTFNSEFSDINCWFDSDKVEKIVYNLLSNAFKYTQINGTITVNISILNNIETHTTYMQHLVEKGINPVGEAIEIAVTDTGRGIAHDKLEKIFNRFYQIENVKAGLQEGTGIGLALAKDLIDLHKGEISVSSELGKGTNFMVKLPVSESFFIENSMQDALNYETDTLELKSVLITEDFQKTGFEQPEISKETNPFNKKILIVEDNVDLRQFLKSCFTDNYTIIEAGNGGEGIEKALKNQPDLILSDVMMPVINGMEMCLRIKQNIETSHIPVILLTARTLLEHQLEGLETGADDYITKPFESEILQLKVRNMIETRTKLAKSFSNNVAVKPNEISVSAVDAEFIEKAIEIINKNMSNEDFNVEAFTKEIGMGRTLFFNKIRKLTNQSVNEFIQTVRLKKAIQLMTESNLRVSEVCYDTGFSNPRYFATCFKKQFGKTPTEYLDEVRKH